MQVGEVLGHFEVEKKQAVDREDYEMAKAKKLQSDNLRRHVYQQLNVCGLVQDPSLLGQHWVGVCVCVRACVRVCVCVRA